MGRVAGTAVAAEAREDHPVTSSQPQPAQGTRRMALWASLVVLALAPRVAVLIARAGTPPELFEYEEAADNLLAGRGYRFHSYGTDYVAFHSGFAYVLLTAGVYRLSHHSHAALLIVQCLVGAGLALVIGALGRRIGGPGVAWLAGGLAALHPGLLYYDTHKLHPLSWDALLVSTATLSLSQMITAPSVRRCAVAGVLSGTALLARGTFVAMVAGGLATLYGGVQGVRRAMGWGLVFAAGAGVVVGPWLLRNHAHLGVPVPMTLSAEQLWRGNNPQATGSSLTPDGRPMIEMADAELREALVGRNEVGQMTVFWEAARTYIARHPGRFVMNVVKKWFHFAWFSPISGALYPSTYLQLYRGYYVVLLLAAGLGAWHLARHWPEAARAARVTAAVVVAVWMTVGLVQSVFYVEMRHRWAVEGLMLVLSAVGLLVWLGHPPWGEAARGRGQGT